MRHVLNWARVDIMFMVLCPTKYFFPLFLVDGKTHTAMPAVDMISVQKQQFPSGCQKYLLSLIEVTLPGRNTMVATFQIYFECFTQQCCILIHIPSKFVSHCAINNGPNIDLVPTRGLAITCSCVDELNKLVVVLLAGGRQTTRQNKVAIS